MKKILTFSFLAFAAIANAQSNDAQILEVNQETKTYLVTEIAGGSHSGNSRKEFLSVNGVVSLIPGEIVQITTNSNLTIEVIVKQGTEVGYKEITN